MPPQGDGDLYGVLGLARGAAIDEVKRAFRALAVRCHPDKCPGDAGAEERFKAINHAHGVLGDPDSKAAYDSVAATAPSAFGRQGSHSRPSAGYTGASARSRSHGAAAQGGMPTSPLRGRRGADGKSSSAWAEAARKPAAQQQPQQRAAQPPPQPQPPPPP
eukprot:Hpha_TRINITY_DN6105_c0_g1::TRINITY_DN6105_c0_g1_i1::g.165014::m.165014